MIVRNDEDYQLKQKQTSEAHAHDLRMIKEGYEQAIKELEGDVRLTKRKRKDCISLNTTCLVAASENALAAARRELSQLKQHNAELSEKCSSQLAFLSKADKEKNALEGKIGDIQSGKAGEVVELNEQIVKITQRKAELHSQVVELEQKLETSQVKQLFALFFSENRPLERNRKVQKRKQHAKGGNKAAQTRGCRSNHRYDSSKDQAASLLGKGACQMNFVLTFFVYHVKRTILCTSYANERLVWKDIQLSK